MPKLHAIPIYTVHIHIQSLSYCIQKRQKQEKKTHIYIQTIA